jgi:hypothetical protein
MSKEMPDHPQNARVADAIAQDAVRRPGPAAPAWSESSLEKRARNRIAEAQRLRWLAYRENKLRAGSP